MEGTLPIKSQFKGTNYNIFTQFFLFLKLPLKTLYTQFSVKGLDGAGKTTALYRFEQFYINLTNPTIATYSVQIHTIITMVIIVFTSITITITRLKIHTIITMVIIVFTIITITITRLKTEQYVNTVPTIGFNCERVRGTLGPRRHHLHHHHVHHHQLAF